MEVSLQFYCVVFCLARHSLHRYIRLSGLDLILLATQQYDRVVPTGGGGGGRAEGRGGEGGGGGRSSRVRLSV